MPVLVPYKPFPLKSKALGSTSRNTVCLCASTNTYNTDVTKKFTFVHVLVILGTVSRQRAWEVLCPQYLWHDESQLVEDDLGWLLP